MKGQPTGTVHHGRRSGMGLDQIPQEGRTGVGVGGGHMQGETMVRHGCRARTRGGGMGGQYGRGVVAPLFAVFGDIMEGESAGVISDGGGVSMDDYEV